MLAPFGVDVTVVEMLPRLLPELDEHLGSTINEIFEKRKIRCFVETTVEDISLGKKGVTGVLSGGQKVEVDRVLVAVGRKPNTTDIGLESVGLATDRGFLRVNDRMETPVGGYYCIGDANGRCLLAHAASGQGIVAVENALGGARDFDAPVPNCVYTFPEIATVGMTQEQAREEHIPVAVGVFQLQYLGKAMAVGETDGFVKVVRHRETDTLLGVHMLGHNVTEVIAAATGLLHEKVTVTELTEVIFAHPTISEGLKESAEDALGMAIHLPPRKILRVAAG
jgi:dihydrolipoamide dehydrogenase